MADEKQSNLEPLITFWRHPITQMCIDACRVLMVIFAALILYQLITEIEAVKLLSYNPCALCENKTGAICIKVDLSKYESCVRQEIAPYLNSSKYLSLLNQSLIKPNNSVS